MSSVEISSLVVYCLELDVHGVSSFSKPMDNILRYDNNLQHFLPRAILASTQQNLIPLCLNRPRLKTKSS